jgi:glycosyltransferase involved in cell wall biosynthesis
MALSRSPAAARRRRVLVCTPFTPRLDARHGGKATAQLLLRLAERNDVALLCLRNPDDPEVDPAIAVRCLVVEEVPVSRHRHVPRRAIWTLGMLRGLPPWAMDCRSSEFARTLERIIDDWRPELAEIHLQAMAQYVHVLKGRGVPTILIDYDPASAWAADLLQTTHGVRRLARRAEVAAWDRYERATRPRFNAIVVFAERDVAAVTPTAEHTAVLRIPLAVEVPGSALAAAGTDAEMILFVGGFRHPPNVDAALWLATTILPRVLERVPAARLELVGYDPPDVIRALAGGPVSVHGSVPDVTPYLDRAAVVAAPIRIGGSMRMKVLEALAAGKAVVATPRAAEGVVAGPDEQFLRADGEHEFADAIAGLLLDEKRRRELGESARNWAEEHLGWDHGVAEFERLYGRLLDGE